MNFLQDNLKILPFSRDDDVQPLIRTLRTCWNIGVQPDDVAYTWHGMSSNVALLPRVVVKGLLYPQLSIAFMREKETVQLVTTIAEQQGLSPREILGVDVPTYICPKKEPEEALFVMSRIGGKMISEKISELQSSSVRGQISQFFILFDEFLKKHKLRIEVPKPQRSDKAKREAPLPECIASMASYLPKARNTAERVEKAKGLSTYKLACFAHNDLNLSNILVDRQPEMMVSRFFPKVGIVDFGEVVFTNPHFVFARMLAAFSCVAGVVGARAGKNIIERTNALSVQSGNFKWADPEICATLMPLFIAEYADSISARAKRRKRDINESETKYLTRGFEGVQCLNQDRQSSTMKKTSSFQSAIRSPAPYAQVRGQSTAPATCG